MPTVLGGIKLRMPRSLVSLRPDCLRSQWASQVLGQNLVRALSHHIVVKQADTALHPKSKCLHLAIIQLVQEQEGRLVTLFSLPYATS